MLKSAVKKSNNNGKGAQKMVKQKKSKKSLTKKEIKFIDKCFKALAGEDKRFIIE
jgi:hypothetical protein